MMDHELKTDPKVFDAVADGKKTFEIRFNDRGFEVGDELCLRRTEHTGDEMRAGAPLIYAGGFWTVEVLHIMHGPAYGLEEGWCIMSIDARLP
jgi:hypothetical protein